MKTTFVRFALAVSFTAGVAASAVAQPNNGALRGTVLDPTGALVPGAQVTVTNADGFSELMASGDTGAFELEGLAAGNYTVSINAAGFTPSLSSVVVSDDAVAKDEVTLRISVEQDVEVFADAK